MHEKRFKLVRTDETNSSQTQTQSDLKADV